MKATSKEKDRGPGIPPLRHLVTMQQGNFVLPNLFQHFLLGCYLAEAEHEKLGKKNLPKILAGEENGQQAKLFSEASNLLSHSMSYLDSKVSSYCSL